MFDFKKSSLTMLSTNYINSLKFSTKMNKIIIVKAAYCYFEGICFSKIWCVGRSCNTSKVCESLFITLSHTLFQHSLEWYLLQCVCSNLMHFKTCIYIAMNWTMWNEDKSQSSILMTSSWSLLDWWIYKSHIVLSILPKTKKILYYYYIYISMKIWTL